jgi:hypothetical protein
MEDRKPVTSFFLMSHSWTVPSADALAHSAYVFFLSGAVGSDGAKATAETALLCSP